MAKETKKLIAGNKKAFHEYFIEDKYEAGISLASRQRLNHCVWEDAVLKKLLYVLKRVRYMYTICI